MSIQCYSGLASEIHLYAPTLRARIKVSERISVQHSLHLFSVINIYFKMRFYSITLVVLLSCSYDVFAQSASTAPSSSLASTNASPVTSATVSESALPQASPSASVSSGLPETSSLNVSASPSALSTPSISSIAVTSALSTPSVASSAITSIVTSAPSSSLPATGVTSPSAAGTPVRSNGPSPYNSSNAISQAEVNLGA
ncbi:hypothetical protein K7432_011076, partial [Basidiobolus ranarum]